MLNYRMWVRTTDRWIFVQYQYNLKVIQVNGLLQFCQLLFGNTNNSLYGGGNSTRLATADSQAYTALKTGVSTPILIILSISTTVRTNIFAEKTPIACTSHGWVVGLCNI